MGREEHIEFQGRVVEVQPGPVVTMYKFEPGSGIKVSQIVNLADDLSMALRAATVRIQAPVPAGGCAAIVVQIAITIPAMPSMLPRRLDSGLDNPRSAWMNRTPATR